MNRPWILAGLVTLLFLGASPRAVDPESLLREGDAAFARGDFAAAADVYLHPTFYDPCSLAVLEAWASGLPVITTRLNGAAELATPERHGFVVSDPRDVGQLAAAMRRLMNADLRASIAAPARALAVANSNAVNFQKIMSVYESVVGRR